MMEMKRVEDRQKALRICRSFGLEDRGGEAFIALEQETVRASGAFLTEAGGCVAVWGLDTGRVFDVKLADALIRAAFHSAKRRGAKFGRLWEGLPAEQRKALDKLGYIFPEKTELETFFSKRHCK